MGKSRTKFMAKVIGLTILVTGLVVALGIVIAKQYGIADVPAILLSSVNAIAVIALSFFTYSYMKATEVMAAEMKATRDMDFEFRHKPKVVVDFRISYSGMLYIEVVNEGNGAARNISFRFEPELRSTSHDCKDFPALQEGIRYLASKKRLTFFFDSSFKFLPSSSARDFTVFSQYEWDIEGKPKIEETYPLQLSPYLKTDLSSYKDESTLIDEVEKIRNALEKIQQASPKRKV